MFCSRFGLGAALAATALALVACSKRAPAAAQDGGGAAGSGAGQMGSAGSAGIAGPEVAGQGAAGNTSGGVAGATDTTGIAGAAGTTTGAAGAAGATGDAGTGDSAGAGGLAGSGSDAGVAGGGGAAGSGVGTGGPEPRLLVIDVAANRLLAYDRHGQIVHDYASQLDFGSGFTNLSADLIALSSNGLEQPRSPFRIFITAVSTPANTTKARLVGIDGQRLAEHSVAGAWEGLGLSPKNDYLYAIRSVFDSGDVAAVFRVADGRLVWQGGPVAQIMFPREGEPLVYVPYDRVTPVRLVDLAAGTDVAPALTQPVFAIQPGVWVTLIASTGARMVILTDGVGRYGRLLWSMDWQAKITRFGAQMPEYTDEYFLGFDATGTKAVWQSQTNGNDGQPIVYAGAYQIDFASMIAGPFSGPFECFEDPSRSTFKIDAGALQTCPCGGAACTTIATLPALENGWFPNVQASADGKTLITYAWGRNAAPKIFPDIKCFSASGAVLATLPYGTASMDPTGQILLYREAAGTVLGRTGIVDLATGTVAWISAAPQTRFMYE
jgi:hypothetical protein